MSHYFYNNIFDHVSSDGNFGYYIEKDYANTSLNELIDPISSPDYIVEIHYLGDPLTTLKMDINGIDTSKINQVEFVPKDIGVVYVQAPDGAFYYDGADPNTNELDTIGLNGWTSQHTAFDPIFGVLEFEIPLASPVVGIDGNSRNHDYLYIDSTLYHHVIV